MESMDRLFNVASTSARGPIPVYVQGTHGGLVWSADGARFAKASLRPVYYAPRRGEQLWGMRVMVGVSCADAVALRHTFRIVGSMIGGVSGAACVSRPTSAETPHVQRELCCRRHTSS